MDAVQGFGVPLPLRADWATVVPPTPQQPPAEQKKTKPPAKKRKAPVKKKKTPVKQKKKPVKKKKTPAKQKIRTDNLPWN